MSDNNNVKALERKRVEQYIEDMRRYINYKLDEQQKNYNANNKIYSKPIRAPRASFTIKTKNNLERLTKVLCNETKFESCNLRKMLLDCERYKILIDFYIVTDSLRIDKKKRKQKGNVNKKKRFTDDEGNYYFTLTLDKFTALRGGTRSSVVRNINLFVFLGLINKYNPYKLETSFFKSQENEREYKKEITKAEIKKNNIDIGDKKIDFNFLSLYSVKTLVSRDFKIAEDKASKLYEASFSISAFSSIYLSKYFGLAEAERVFFHENLREFTVYSDFLQNEIKKAVVAQVAQYGYTNKRNVFNAVKDACVAHDFEIIERYGRPRASRKNTFETEYKRVKAEILKENKNLRLSSTPTNKMKQVFNLKDGQYIWYDINKLK